MKKWFGTYLGVLIAAVIVLSAVVGISKADEAQFGVVNETKGYSSQVVTKNGEDFVLYRYPDETKTQIVKADKDLKEYKTEGTVINNGVNYIFSFKEEGKKIFGIDPVVRNEEWVTPVFEAEGTFFATGATEREILVSIIAEDGRMVTEYMLPMNVENPQWTEKTTFTVSEEHFALYGSYVEDELLFVREDGKIFNRSVVVKEVKENIAETPLALNFENKVMAGAETTWKLNSVKTAFKYCLIPAVVIAILIVLILHARREKSHIVFRLVCAVEIVCIVVLSLAGYIFSSKVTEQKVLEQGIEAGYALEEIRLEQRADDTVKTEVYWNLTEERKTIIEDFIIANPSGEIIMSKTLPAGMNVDVIYGKDAVSLATKAASGREVVMTELEKDGYNNYAVALRDWTEMEPSSIFIAVLSEEGIALKAGEAAKDVWNIVAILMAVITAANIAIYIFFAGRWKRLTEGMAYVATNRKAFDKVPVTTDGLESAWASLDRIGHNTNKLYYERDMLYRSYYRFVPKGMDALLEKDETADIEIGDINKVRGCMVEYASGDIKNFDGSRYMRVMNESLEAMHKVREKRGGIFIGASADLKERKIFFENNSTEALKFAIELLHTQDENATLSDNESIMMLYESNFDYGVSGVKEMMTPFMYCAQERILEPYINALAKAKVKIALTEQTLRFVGNGFTTRYIGFVSGGETEGSIKIYECLDAYDEGKRKLMASTDSMFQKAIELFYSNDFYLARNMFNEVLKLNDKDNIARWYLFHCEYHLNNP